MTRQTETKPHVLEMLDEKADTIVCPFCGQETPVNKWQISGSDKSCDCGARHTDLGTSYRLMGTARSTGNTYRLLWITLLQAL